MSPHPTTTSSSSSSSSSLTTLSQKATAALMLKRARHLGPRAHHKGPRPAPPRQPPALAPAPVHTTHAHHGPLAAAQRPRGHSDSQAEVAADVLAYSVLARDPAMTADSHEADSRSGVLGRRGHIVKKVYPALHVHVHVHVHVLVPVPVPVPVLSAPVTFATITFLPSI
jgi:hypothetical protein